MREYANIGKWGCRSQKNPVEMMSSNTQITLAEFLTLLLTLFLSCQTLLSWLSCSSSATESPFSSSHCSSGNFVPHFPPRLDWAAELLQHPLLRLLPSHPSTFPCAQECPFLVLVHISLLPVYKASCKVKHQSAPSSQPRKVPPCSDPALVTRPLLQEE